MKLNSPKIVICTGNFESIPMMHFWRKLLLRLAIKLKKVSLIEITNHCKMFGKKIIF